MNDINSKVVKATKWSSVTELASKLVSPISTMVLARILAPEAFGVLVTVTMVITFAEVLTDAGFQKYIVQHKFDSEDALFKSTTVAFWANLTMSLVIWIAIILFRDPLAELVGNAGYGSVIAVASICIPLAAFSSIQMAMYRRLFDFKTLFYARMIGVLVPLAVTIPLAYILRSYWALVWGMIALNCANAIFLTIKSRWRPTLFFDWSLLHAMLSFSIWSMMEAISIWLTTYVDIFFIGRMLDGYYLGLYRTSMNTVGQIVGLITASTTPVLFSALSKLQDDKTEFEGLFLKFQKLVGYLVIPLGFGIFVFRGLITDILLGSKWSEAAFFMGLWGLTSSITIVLSHYSSEIYRSLGKPKISFWVQLTQIACIIGVIIWALPLGYKALCEWRALVRLELVVANLLVMWTVIKMSPWKMIKNVLPSLLCATVVSTIMIFVVDQTNVLTSIVYAILSIIIYVALTSLFPEERKVLKRIPALIFKRRS